MKFALFNYSTGEIYITEGECITCQYLYKRALHCRRKAVYYGHALDNMRLLRVTGESLHDGVTIEEWTGGLNTPIEEMGFCVRAYYMLKRRGCNTAEEVAQYIRSVDIFRRASREVLLDIVRRMKPYDEEATQILIRNINKRRAYYGQ